MKKRAILVTCLALGMTVTVSAFTHKVISANMKSQAITYKGNTINQEVIVHNNTTYVPLRSFSELVGVPTEYKEGVIYLGDQVSNTNSSVVNNGNNSYIGEAKAKSIALQHAGLQENNVTITKVRLEKDYNRYEYEVEFFAGNKEYDYEIDAITGEIISYDFDIEGFQIPNGNTTNNNSNNNTTNSSNNIGKEKAEQIALEHAGLTKEQVTYIQSELDKEHGRWEYQVEFRYNYNEYEYDINATTGEIMNHSVERD